MALASLCGTLSASSPYLLGTSCDRVKTDRQIYRV